MIRFFLLLASLIVTGPSAAGNDSQCSVDTIPLQFVNETKSGPETTLAETNLSDFSSPFRNFVIAVMKHVAIRMENKKYCINGGENKSLLQFVNWPLITSVEAPLDPNQSIKTFTFGDCRISSPWVDLAIEKGSDVRIRAVIRWNQRQLLVDQAMLAGERGLPSGVAMPLRASEFKRMAKDYAVSEILHEQVATPIEEQVPPDILWLFRRSWQSTRGPFDMSARGSMDIAMEKAADRYTNLVIGLMDRCFVSSHTDIRLLNILDVANPSTLEHYKIDTPIR